MKDGFSFLSLIISIASGFVGSLFTRFLARMKGGLIQLALTADEHNATIINRTTLDELKFREDIFQTLAFDQDYEIILHHADQIWPAFRSWTTKPIEDDTKTVGIYYCLMRSALSVVNVGNSPAIMLGFKIVKSSLDHAAIIQVDAEDCDFPITLKEGEMQSILISITINARTPDARGAHDLLIALSDEFDLTLSVRWLSISALITRQVRTVSKQQKAFFRPKPIQEDTIAPNEFEFAITNLEKIRAAILSDRRIQIQQYKEDHKVEGQPVKQLTENSHKTLVGLMRFAYEEDITCIPLIEKNYIVLFRNDDPLSMYGWHMTVVRYDSESVYCMCNIDDEILKHHNLKTVELVDIDERFSAYNHYLYSKAFWSSLGDIEIIKSVIMVLEIENAIDL